jgi:FMN phosphatase YigB (HAD superfamily)
LKTGEPSHPLAELLLQRGLRTVPGLRVYPATTNPRLVILGKLAAGGLTDASGTMVFDDCFGGDEVSPGGKCGPGFYHALCARTGTEPSRCYMVGDNPRADLDYAREAGIERVFIVQRDQSAPERGGSDGAMFIESLDEALSSIKAACGM